MTQVFTRSAPGGVCSWIDHECIDRTVISTYEVTNPPGDGDSTVEITITQTEQISGDVVSTSTITLSLENGTYFGSVDPVDITNGTLTFNMVNDDGETSAGTQIINLENWLRNQIIGSGATTVTWTGDQFDISSEDDASTVTPGNDVNGNPTWTYQPVDLNGNPNGTPVLITDTNTKNVTLNLNSTDPSILELTDSDGNVLSVDLSGAICAAMNKLPETTC